MMWVYTGQNTFTSNIIKQIHSLYVWDNATNVKNVHLDRDSNPGPWNTVPVVWPQRYEDAQWRNLLLTSKHIISLTKCQIHIKNQLVQYYYRYITTNMKNMHLHRDSNPGPWNTLPMLWPLSYKDAQRRNMLRTSKHQMVIVGDKQISTKTRRPWH